MLSISPKHLVATVAVAAGLLVPAASASAATQPSGLIADNGHAGITDGTSNTIQLTHRAARFSIDVGTSESVAAGEARQIDLAGPFTPNNWLGAPR